MLTTFDHSYHSFTALYQSTPVSATLARAPLTSRLLRVAVLLSSMAGVRCASRALLCAWLLCAVCVDGVLGAGSVYVDWGNTTRVSQTTSTLQMVMNPLVTRASPVHDAVYDQLAELSPSYARFQAWFPYPRLSVAELFPPSGLSQCSDVAVGYAAELSCKKGGGVIKEVEFAAFGQPQGVCTAYAHNSSCTAQNSTSIVQLMCVGKQNCTVPASTALFGNPCPANASEYRLVVQVTCDPPQNHTYTRTHTTLEAMPHLPSTFFAGCTLTLFPRVCACCCCWFRYWDFELLDGVVLDFLAATGGLQPILDLSTQPNWLYWYGDTTPYHVPDNPYATAWDYTAQSILLDPTAEMVGQYFGRVAAWYMQGGFYDEYGQFTASGHRLEIPFWEVLNEMEHSTDVDTVSTQPRQPWPVHLTPCSHHPSSPGPCLPPLLSTSASTTRR